MNRREKAQKNERRCRDELEKDNWAVERMQYSGNIYQKRKDFFGLWDIIALRGNEIKFVQVKTNRIPGMDMFKAFKDEHSIIQCEIWIWYEEGISAKYSLEWRKIIL
mgnify:CR=1 FL=1